MASQGGVHPVVGYFNSLVGNLALCFQHGWMSMNTQRFTPKYKEEAVKQVTERGYSVAEISTNKAISI